MRVAHKLIEPPYRKKRFYLHVRMTGQQVRNGRTVDVETEARGEVFEVRRRAAAVVSEAGKQKLSERSV